MGKIKYYDRRSCKIGMHKIRERMNEKDCDFILDVGSGKKLIKRKKFEKYILSQRAI